MMQTVLVFSAALAYGALHSFLAGGWAKNVAGSRIGPGADRFYRLVYNAVAVITLVPLLAVLGRNIGPVLLRVPWPWWILPVSVQVAGLALCGAAFLQSDPAHFLGFRQLGVKEGTGGSLRTGGLYGWTRHPMYTFGLLALWCFPILTAGILGLDLGITLYILIGSELEERRLIAEFGGEYLRYRSKVARLIPFIL